MTGPIVVDARPLARPPPTRPASPTGATPLVDRDSPLHIQVTITVFEEIENFQVAG